MNWRAPKPLVVVLLLLSSGADLLVVGSIAGSIAGCGEPCRDLSEKVCRCESTETAQRACLQGLDSYQNASGSSAAQQESCTELLPGCTCDKLATGDFAACGLAREAESNASGS